MVVPDFQISSGWVVGDAFYGDDPKFYDNWINWEKPLCWIFTKIKLSIKNIQRL